MTGVLDLFLPRERKFFDMFDELAANIVKGSNDFLKFVREYDNLTKKQKQKFLEEIKEIEHDCDKLAYGLAIELNKTFITPFDREDLHKFSTLLDDIMDVIYNTSEKLVLYNIRKLPKYVIELTETAHESVLEIRPLLYSLRTKHKIMPHLKKIHDLEEKADSLRNTALGYMFSDSMEPVDIIKFKDIYEMLELVTDMVEDVADLVENIVIKHG